MIKQIMFSFSIIVTLVIFGYTTLRYIFFFKLTKPFPIKDIGKRIILFLKVGIFQSKILRKPVIGLLHALVFWGFCSILFDTVEAFFDGILGLDHCMIFWGKMYILITASEDIFALIVGLSILAFMIRRFFMHIKRFTGIEMQHKNHQDANVALTLIFLLMVTLIGKNIYYILSVPGAHKDIFPVSNLIAEWMGNINIHTAYVLYQVNWWLHILMIFAFANILPYSKHFHVFMSLPNVFLSRLEPLGKLFIMDNVLKEVKLMMYPELASTEPTVEPVSRFGVMDADDVSWKTYLDSLTCTQCGRCTASCPANITGKMLSPRKLFMDLRARMKEKGLGLKKNGKEFDDNKALLRDYINPEELWACTTCNACAQECPLNINHPSFIIDMRRYLVMEEASAPSGLNAMFANIENNGAPWQYSPEDRLIWLK